MRLRVFPCRRAAQLVVAPVLRRLGRLSSHLRAAGDDEPMRSEAGSGSLPLPRHFACCEVPSNSDDRTLHVSRGILFVSTTGGCRDPRFVSSTLRAPHLAASKLGVTYRPEHEPLGAMSAMVPLMLCHVPCSRRRD